MSKDMSKEEQTAVFGGGCFWCIEAVFQRLTGVTHVESGYMGGRADQATYKQVCDGDTGHVEVVRVTFDPAQISYRDLLDVFFAVHDPTTVNRQGNDAGEQYRSVIFYADDEQQKKPGASEHRLEDHSAEPEDEAINRDMKRVRMQKRRRKKATSRPAISAIATVTMSFIRRRTVPTSAILT